MAAKRKQMQGECAATKTVQFNILVLTKFLLFTRAEMEIGRGKCGKEIIDNTDEQRRAGKKMTIIAKELREKMMCLHSTRVRHLCRRRSAASINKPAAFFHLIPDCDYISLAALLFWWRVFLR